MERIAQLLKELSITAKNESLIKQAFIHRSYLNEAKKDLVSNERLEFLGDSILSYLVSDYLYDQFPDFPEGQLTNLRSSMVKTATLAEIARELHLGDLLVLSKGEEEGGGRKNISLLADTFEAFLGAVYLDQGIPPTKKILAQFLFPKLLQIMKHKLYKDAKSSFQEEVQEKERTSPEYKVLAQKGPDHAKIFTVGVFVEGKLWGEGTGKSKQEAEQLAAYAALEKWKEK